MSVSLKAGEYLAGEYDVIVVGGGHAGCEAALASSRMGVKTLLITLNPEYAALLPCNPAIGGPAKSTVVREIDALGGAMAALADKTQIQIRMLNTGKGPAVRALRAQIDKPLYQRHMLRLLQEAPLLDLRQGEVSHFLLKNGAIAAAVCRGGAVFAAAKLILACGTYLRGKITIGEFSRPSGPQGLPEAQLLGEFLQSLGLEMARFKTGTPARVDKKSIDFSQTLIQPGSADFLAFSYATTEEIFASRPNVPCWLTYTNELTHDVIRRNLNRSPLYSGNIQGIGPRYCPSIEDKVVRFPDRNSHQLFLEPEGLNCREYYVQGMSSSLPEEVQAAFLRTIPGLERVVIVRPAYAIEYDCLQPTQLKPSLEHKEINGLFAAGQINGTSGYEEAGGQGLLAGVNAAAAVKDLPPLYLGRDNSYIGVLVDDLVHKGVEEPYRLFTSLSEYRLLLRQDNADMRLCAAAMEYNLISAQRAEIFAAKKDAVEKEILRLRGFFPSREQLCAHSKLSAENSSLAALLRRADFTYTDALSFSAPPKPLSSGEAEEVEISLKYEGYIQRQLKQVRRFQKLEKKTLSPQIDYALIRGLSHEAAQKLNKMRPASIGQASRISGVSPADINVLLFWLKKENPATFSPN
jgi:tRNA uridine 5-carboxymethylaminomethyl modification enzyme